ncbi:hypothetical protein EFK50_20175 [Nocardioides marmoriginsengisoli]|uniref:Uncharacterized protein n=1 Tax=Nocardioides marmoriginsengisoli TaxID=661483 RepID=A0A3N0CCC8_9ACTN|nr:hypothetical protein [Nocardioides marmoriginsengisoli]RNL60633.1 hypothetical protein EFK50_20175 [Nocardioides marmoriginsengisoli]
MAAEVQNWELAIDGRRHRVSVRPSGITRVITWSVDGTTVIEKKSGEDKLVLTDPDGGHGSVRCLFTALGRSRQVTWFEPGADLTAQIGFGGIDLDPEPGSKAALREEKMRAHPKRYAARHVVAGVAKVVLPILLTLLVARFAIRIDWPDWNLPSLPRPNLPDLIPDLPDIDLPDLSLPGWVQTILNNAKYVVPVLIGIGLASNEVKRRRKQDELKQELRARAAAAEDEKA